MKQAGRQGGEALSYVAQKAALLAKLAMRSSRDIAARRLKSLRATVQAFLRGYFFRSLSTSSQLDM